MKERNGEADKLLKQGKKEEDGTCKDAKGAN